MSLYCLYYSSSTYCGGLRRVEVVETDLTREELNRDPDVAAVYGSETRALEDAAEHNAGYELALAEHHARIQQEADDLYERTEADRAAVRELTEALWG